MNRSTGMKFDHRRWLALAAVSVGLALTSQAAHAAGTIRGLSRVSGPLHALVSIYGDAFGEAQGPSIVTVADRQVTVISWTNSAIIVSMTFRATEVPALDQQHPVVVRTGRNLDKSNEVQFLLTSEPPTPVVGPGAPGASDQPRIDTGSGPNVDETHFRGFRVTLSGLGFGPAQARGRVEIDFYDFDEEGNLFYVGTILATVLNWSDSSITIFFDADLCYPEADFTVIRDNGKSDTITLFCS